MKSTRARWFLAVLATVVLATACNHPVDIIGEGDVLSATGTRDCTLADHAAGDCATNQITGHYDETYTAVPAPGWHFHRWHNCDHTPTEPSCSFNISEEVVTHFAGGEAPPLTAIFRPDVNTGFDSLFIGHSFFAPIASELEPHPTAAGFADHTQQVFFRGGSNGAPEAMWNDEPTRTAIQAVLAEGDTDLFAMTYHPQYPEPDGYLDWIGYAVEHNPDTRVVIGIPWLTNPASMDTATYASIWRGWFDVATPELLEVLRDQFPGVDIVVMPYGEVAIALRELFDAGELPDVTQLQSATDGIFRDTLGHGSPILIDLATMVFLQALYGVDLDTYAYDPGYQTDLKAIADGIVDAWNPAHWQQP